MELPQPSTLDDPPASGVRFRVLAWCCLLALIAYLQRNSISVMQKSISRELELTEDRMGIVLSGFYWGYAISQIPAGWLGNRWGTRRALGLYMLASSLLTALLGFSVHFLMLLTVGIGVGIAQAGFFPCCANSFSKWFPSRSRALPSGFLTSSMSIGGAIASALTGWLLAGGGLSWHQVYWLYAVPGVVWATLFFRSFRDRPEDHPGVNPRELALIRGPARGGTTAAPPGPAPAEGTPWGRMLVRSTIYFICGQAFFRSAGYVFYATWFPTFLMETRHVDIEQAGLLTSLPLIGVVAGGLTGGPTSDWLLHRTGSRRISRQFFAAATQFICGVLVFAAYFVESAPLAVLVIAIGAYSFAFGGCCSYTVTIDVAGQHVPTIFGTMNMMGNFGAALCPIVVGWLVKRGVPWEPILFLFAGIYFAAAFCWACVNPNRTVFDEPVD